jgi:myo-inositol-1(or 4)-monophosphatase
MLAAATGEGCWWNGRRACMSTVTALKDALITCTDPASFAQHNRGAEWERLQKSSYARAGWGDAYGYILVATGRAELMLDPIVNVWDLAPFPPIFREAGGYFGDWQGNETIYAHEGIATTQILLPQVLQVIRGEAADASS